MRVQRDIPSPLIVDGVKNSNLRQIVQRKLVERKMRCRCIRCREVGHKLAVDGTSPDLENLKTTTTKYRASEGEEIFISVEDLKKDVLIGYLRLRVPSEKAHRLEIKNKPSAIVRELRVYGPLVPVGKHLAKAWQHKGYGRTLLAEAERMTKEEYCLKKIAVISALGTKQYYKRLGYQYDGVYVSKGLEN